VLLRLAYLTVANTFAVLRLLPMADRVKDAEILALRHHSGGSGHRHDGERVHGPTDAAATRRGDRRRPGSLGHGR